jgi:hypothetical protein
MFSEKTYIPLSNDKVIFHNIFYLVETALSRRPRYFHVDKGIVYQFKGIVQQKLTGVEIRLK